MVTDKLESFTCFFLSYLNITWFICSLKVQQNPPQFVRVVIYLFSFLSSGLNFDNIVLMENEPLRFLCFIDRSFCIIFSCKLIVLISVVTYNLISSCIFFYFFFLDPIWQNSPVLLFLLRKFLLGLLIKLVLLVCFFVSSI